MGFEVREIGTSNDTGIRLLKQGKYLCISCVIVLCQIEYFNAFCVKCPL